MLPSLNKEPACSTSPAAIKENDLVIVYENINSMKAVHVNVKARYDSRFGSFPHKDWIGLPFGSKVRSVGGSRGWVYLLAPTPDLWSLVLRHRTQILYIADISTICMYLELKPGAVVLESGTGSGSLTHSLARAVAPTGHVYSFEHHLERANEAQAELQANGLGSCVTVRHRDVEGRGFPCGGALGVVSETKATNDGGKEGVKAQADASGSKDGGAALVDESAAKANGSYGATAANADGCNAGAAAAAEAGGKKEGGSTSSGQQGEGDVKGEAMDLAGRADAVFLDLPAPPKAIPSAAVCLKPNGRLCSFSPCIEQVQNVCRALELAGFTDLQTVECLLRSHEVRAERIDTLVSRPVSTKPQQQQQAAASTQGPPKRQRVQQQESGEGAGDLNNDGGAEGLEADGDEAGGAQGEGADGVVVEGQLLDSRQEQGSAQPATGIEPQLKAGEQAAGGKVCWQPQASTLVSSCPSQAARGHTGYLTFARKWVG